MAKCVHAAGFKKNPEVISVLLKAGAEVNAKDDDGETPLHSAASLGDNHEVISVLYRCFRCGGDDETSAEEAHYIKSGTESKPYTYCHSNPKEQTASDQRERGLNLVAA